jgi:D-alanine-D-alanine ligase
MKHVAVMRAGWLAERAALLGSDCGGADPLEGPLGQIKCDRASEAFERAYAKVGPLHIASENLKPNIYYKAQDSALRAYWAQGRCAVSRADFHFKGATGDEGELVGLDVNTERGMTETSPAPEMAAHAGSSFDEPVAWMAEDASCGC